MVKIVQGGSAEFNLLAFGETNPTTLQYIEHRSNTFSNNLTDTARDLFQTTKLMFEQIHGSEAMRKARAAIRSVTGLFQQDTVRPMCTIQEFQQAALTMQRWIMAEPTVRAAYHAQQCDGYTGSYVDMAPGMVGRDHYDFRLVNDGVLHEEDDGEDFKVTFFFDEIMDGDRLLRPEEKVDILSSWEAVRAAMKAGGSDPTSILDDQL